MNCSQWREALVLELEGHLEAARRAEFDAHVHTCEACSRYRVLMRETTCRHVAEFLSEYMEQRLPQAQAQVFEDHLRMCPPCLEYLRALRTTIEAGREACRCEDGGGKVPAALVQAILRARKQAPS